MAYLVLARKHRPQQFSEIVGQSQVSTTLANAITQDRVAHAYLFCGPRGVGKTTAARILAKALNCEQGPTPTPCNTCDSCVSITRGSSMEVLEIDGASNRGINEVRELRENTRYAAADGRTKVYIIDEVHMLTTEAFNALLKTLEEPPPHVVFVLATTDPFKMPGTILSRCQRFDFSRITSKDITAYLVNLVKIEKAGVSEEALALLARRAQGAMRDALSLLDQVLSATEGDADRKTVEDLLGLVGDDVYFAMVDAIAEQDTAAVLALLDQIYRKGAALEEVAQGLARHFRNLFVIRTDANLGDLLETTSSELPRYMEQAARFDPALLNDLFSRVTGTAQDLRRSDDPRLTLELTLVDLVHHVERVPLADLAARLLALEARLGAGVPAPGASGPGKKPVSPQARTRKSAGAKKKTGGSSAAPAVVGRSPRISAPPPEDKPAAPKTKEGQVWLDCLTRLKAKDIVLWSKLQDIPAVGFHESGKLMLQTDTKHALQREAMQDLEVGTLLNALLQEASVPGFMLQGTQEEKTEKPQSDDRALGEVFNNEPKLQKVLDLFDGEVLS